VNQQKDVFSRRLKMPSVSDAVTLDGQQHQKQITKFKLLKFIKKF